MSTESEQQAADDEVPPPDFLIPGIRVALEMALVGSSVAMMGLWVEEPLFIGVVILTTFSAMIVVLFWRLNKQMGKWIKHAKGKPSMEGDAELDSL
jgi:hypothetical protein